MPARSTGWRSTISSARIHGQATAAPCTRFGHAAGQGHVPAQLLLAQMYESGWGVASDRAQAIRWYRQAAASGDSLAAGKLRILGAGEAAMRQHRAAGRLARGQRDMHRPHPPAAHSPVDADLQRAVGERVANMSALAASSQSRSVAKWNSVGRVR